MIPYDSPRPSPFQSQFDASTPPPPPPKPSAHSSGRGTPQLGPPLPPPPGQAEGQAYSSYNEGATQQSYAPAPPDPLAGIEPPREGWLPAGLKDKTTVDLQHILETPSLQQALINDASTTHPSLPAANAAVQDLLAANLSLAESLKQLESHLHHQRQETQSRLLALRALERQWHAKQTEQDHALQDFSPRALYQRLSAAIAEQESLCKGMEESFLEGDRARGAGPASEREVAEFVKRLRDARKVAYLRRERKERWDEGRVGGWR